MINATTDNSNPLNTNPPKNNSNYGVGNDPNNNQNIGHNQTTINSSATNTTIVNSATTTVSNPTSVTGNSTAVTDSTITNNPMPTSNSIPITSNPSPVDNLNSNNQPKNNVNPGFPVHNPAQMNKAFMGAGINTNINTSAIADTNTKTNAETNKNINLNTLVNDVVKPNSQNLITSTPQISDKTEFDNISSNNNSNSNNNSGKIKPKKKFNLKMILGSVALLFIIVGAGAGFYLTQYTQQDIRQQAYENETCRQDSDCDAGERCADIDTSDPYDPVGHCVADCRANNSCLIGAICDSNENCAGSFVECRGGTCTDVSTCQDRNDCAEGQSCVPGAGDCTSGLECNNISNTCQITGTISCNHKRSSSEVAAANNCTPGGNLCDAAGDGGTSCRISNVDYCCYGDDTATSCDGGCYQGSTSEVTCSGNTITNNSGHSITINRYTSNSNSCPAHNSQGSSSLGNGSSITADCEQLDVLGYCGVCSYDSSCSGGGTPPDPTYSCNSSCTADSQCSDANSDWTCDDTTNKCRLASNPTSETCEAGSIVGPMCMNIDILDENSNIIDPTNFSTELTTNKTIKFQCAAINLPTDPAVRYKFKITQPDGIIISNIDPPNVNSSMSLNYTIPAVISGPFTAECEICTDTWCSGFPSDNN